MTGTLLIFGHGYSAAALSRQLVPQGWTVIGTTRSPDRMDAIAAMGATPVLWPGDDITPWLDRATHVLAGAAPGPEGDPVLAELQDEIAGRAARLAWVGYLSTTAVYGDHDGGWVDEDTPLAPASKRGAARAEAEAAWAVIPGLPLHIFRLPGIYGPGRGPFAKLKNGTARRLIKPGQVFSRIHVDDLARALALSMQAPQPGAIYNVCDDDPAPPQDVIAHAADLLGLPLPPAEDFETADLTPMARSFYGESKRVRNSRIKEALGYQLTYPDFRSGLASILAAES
ncbi:SDR family oxidoreductase [Mesobacterium pallidum]|uniref:SDR family oxidoreductase n=1 Tax=Mesobacterium pallidum TaxID=2872037 RepID=UPI001EE1AFE8|nr:SDR family oxidoreductase [Mesobacterium pallidum]